MIYMIIYILCILMNRVTGQLEGCCECFLACRRVHVGGRRGMFPVFFTPYLCGLCGGPTTPEGEGYGVCSLQSEAGSERPRQQHLAS